MITARVLKEWLKDIPDDYVMHTLGECDDYHPEGDVGVHHKPIPRGSDVSMVGPEVVFAPFKKTTLDDLLAKCDFNAPPNPELVEWEAMPPVGEELI